MTVLRAIDVARYVEELAPRDSGIPNDDNGFTFGNPEEEVRGMGVTWMPTKDALEQAVRLGLNLLVVHESWWHSHQNSPWYAELPAWSKKGNLGRLDLLVKHGLCLYRCHSNWDARAGDGVADRFGPALGLGSDKEIARGRFTRVYEIDPLSLAALAGRIKHALELPGVRFFGDPDRVVGRVAPLIGGFGGNQRSMPEEVFRMGAEAIVCGDLIEDINLHALELGLGVIETLHSASENAGVKRLAELLQKRFPDMPVRYIESGARPLMHIV